MKKYTKPEMEVIELKSRAHLLVGSGEDRYYNRKAYKEDGLEEADQL